MGSKQSERFLKGGIVSFAREKAKLVGKSSSGAFLLCKRSREPSRRFILKAFEFGLIKRLFKKTIENDNRYQL